HGLSSGSAIGRFDVGAVKVVAGGQLVADNPVVLNVKDVLRLSGDAHFGTAPPSAVQPGDGQVNGRGRGAKLGKGPSVQAFVRAPNGKVLLGRGTTMSGQVIGQKVVLQKGAVLQLAGGCGDGVRGGTEDCDPTAPNGDQACPGKCIALGLPGQCTCACTTDHD